MTAPKRTTTTIAELPGLKGTELGTSEWFEVTQDSVNLFAEATGDHQWIHVDAEAAKSGPFGATIAHGYLTLALSSFFAPQLVTIEGFTMGINYGVDKVRFPSPVLVGSKVRARGELMEVTEIPGGFQVKNKITIEAEGGTKPACVIESLSRYLK